MPNKCEDDIRMIRSLFVTTMTRSALMKICGRLFGKGLKHNVACQTCWEKIISLFEEGKV